MSKAVKSILNTKNNEVITPALGVMRFVFSVLFVFIGLALFSQETRGLKPLDVTEQTQTGVTKAVIVGISDYQNEKITDLQYADRDAQMYAEYLMSADGGRLDSSSITLLLNEQATSGNFVAALYGLLEECTEGDQVIIYFAGHGDVESTTINQPGFLLCWDAPAKVYMGGGTFGLNYLQDIISTLSLRTKAKVVVITDACRSGKLAGSGVGGAQATAANLSKQYANEVKIMSCQPNEFALEGKNWGGGRGVFSYYFMRGLQGLADRNKDGQVSLSEIDRYLEDMVSIAVAPHQQMPLTVGSKSAILSTVNPEVLARLLEEEKNGQGLAPVEGRAGILTAGMIGDTSILNRYQDFLGALKSKHLLYPKEGSAWSIYQEIKDSPSIKELEGLMRRNLAAALQDEAQQAINDYLSADPKELEKRWSYSSDYDQYPESLEKAAQLLGKDHFFYTTLRSRYYYFKGLLQRLDAERLESEELYNSALQLQDSCLLLEPNAPFALNEKGLIYQQTGNYQASIDQFELALVQTPEWPLLWSNLNISHHELGELEEAVRCGKKSYEIDSTFVLGLFNTGNSLVDMGNLEEAQQLYIKGISLDSSDIQLKYQLARLYLIKGEIKTAEDIYLDILHMQPSKIATLISLGHLYLKSKEVKKAKKFFLKARSIDPLSEQAFQGIIEYYFYTDDLNNAQRNLQDYIKVYSSDSFSHYLIASIAANKGKKRKSLKYLELALEKGFNQIETLDSDVNLNEVRQCKKYRKLINKHFPTPSIKEIP